MRAAAIAVIDGLPTADDGNTQNLCRALLVGRFREAINPPEVNARLSGALGAAMQLKMQDWDSSDIVWLVEATGKARAVDQLTQQLANSMLAGRLSYASTVPSPAGDLYGSSGPQLLLSRHRRTTYFGATTTAYDAVDASSTGAEALLKWSQMMGP